MDIKDNANQGGLIHKPLYEFERKKVEWLPSEWPQFKIPRGKITLFVGDPGNGKSFVVENIIAQLTKEHGSRVIVLSEDDPSDTLKPRIEEMGGNSKLVEIIEGTRNRIGQNRGFVLKTDLAHFKQLVKEQKPDLVLFDPLVSYAGGVDTFKGNEVRAFLDPYVNLAAEHGFALVCVIHLNKADTKAIYKICDSTQFAAIAKSIYIVGPNPHPNNPDDKVVCHLKTNVSKKTPSYSFHIEELPEDPDLAKLVWGQEVDLSADDLVGSFAAKGKGDNVNKTEVAVSFLSGALRRGPQPTTELETLATEMDIKPGTLKRARKSLGATSKRIGGVGSEGAWVSYLPGYEKAPSHGEHEPLNSLAVTEIQSTLTKISERLGNLENKLEPLSDDPLRGHEH